MMLAELSIVLIIFIVGIWYWATEPQQLPNDSDCSSRETSYNKVSEDLEDWQRNIFGDDD